MSGVLGGKSVPSHGIVMNTEADFWLASFLFCRIILPE